MKYTFNTEVLDDRDLVFRLPKEIELVEVFLGSDIGNGVGSREFFLGAIDLVLSGKEQDLFVRGNICGLEIRPEFTRVVDTLADDGEGDACEIETVELKKLIEVWLEHQEKFHEEQKAQHDRKADRPEQS